MDYVNKLFALELDKSEVINLLNFCNKNYSLVKMISEISFDVQRDLNHTKVEDFLYAKRYIKDRHTNYYDELERMFKCNEIIVSDYNCANASCDSYTGKIWIGLSHSILDDLYLVHEFFHHQNLIPINDKQGKEENLTRKMFGEVISYLGQFDMVDWMSEDVIKNECLSRVSDCINDCINSAKTIRVELFLINIFKKYGRIDEDLIRKEVLDCKDDFLTSLVLEYFDKVLKDICGWGADFKFPFYLKYVLGISIAFYLRDRLKIDCDIWEKIYYVNEHIYDMSVEELLKLLEIDLSGEELMLSFKKQCDYLNNGEFKKVK